MVMDFSSGNVTLFHGDALRVLTTLTDASVDAVLTDPPYSSGGQSMSARQADPAQKYQQSGTKRQYPPMLGDNKDQRSWTLWSTLWLSECWRIAQDGAPLMVFTDWRQLPALTDAVQAAAAWARHASGRIAAMSALSFRQTTTPSAGSGLGKFGRSANRTGYPAQSTPCLRPRRLSCTKA